MTIHEAARSVIDGSKYVYHITSDDADVMHSVLITKLDGSAFARVYVFEDDAETVYLD